MKPSMFIQKIPNRTVLRDFLENNCRLYCPPFRDMNKQFITDVLQEKKFLLPLEKIKWISQAP